MKTREFKRRLKHLLTECGCDEHAQMSASALADVLVQVIERHGHSELAGVVPVRGNATKMLQEWTKMEQWDLAGIRMDTRD